MDLASSLAAIAFAALIHASFQLSVSVLSLLSGHAIGARHSHARLTRLMSGFIFGSAVMTLLLLSFACLVLLQVFGSTIPPLMWIIGCGLLLGIGVAVWLFYYRKDRGTTLWIPRTVASYLTERTKKTRRSAEAFGLGLSSVFGELLFIVAPLIVSAMIVITLQPLWQLVSLGVYTVISLSSSLIVASLVGGGHKLSTIQRWREKNKYFLQFAAGSGLVILAFYLYVHQVTMLVAIGGVI